MECFADVPSCRVIVQGHGSDNFFGAVDDDDLSARFEEMLDTGPLVAEHAGACASDLENSRWRCVSVRSHRGAIDVHHHARRAVHRVVTMSWNVPDPAHIFRHWLVAPAFTAKEELLVRGKFRRLEEQS